MDTKRHKILYLIQLPPPVHGVSTINSLIYHSQVINAGFNKCLLELKFSEGFSQLRRFNLKKITTFYSLSIKLYKVLRIEQPDIVYFSIMPVGIGFWRDLLLVRIIKKSGVSPIYHIHNRGIAENSSRPILRKLYQYVFRNSTVIHLSNNLMKHEIWPLNLKNTSLAIVPNGIPHRITPASGERKEFITILFLSNLFPEKGIYDVLEIIDKVREHRSDIRLRIVGAFLREKFKKKLTREIKRAGLSDVITLVDPRYDGVKDDDFSNSDIFLFPSYFRQECFPLVLIEAMMHQLPIISSNIGAIPEMIENGKEGILLPERDIDGFANAILMLADDPQLRENLGAAAKLKFLQHYTDKNLEEKMSEVFENNFRRLK